MKRYIMRLHVIGLILVSLMAVEEPKDAIKKEYDKFEGTWKMESFMMDGKPSPIKDFADFKMTLKGDTFTTEGAEGKSSGTYKIDPTKKPKTLDIIFVNGALDGVTMLGVYELDGDTYKVCLPTAPGAERPKELASKEGSGLVLEVFKRIKP
jgi:uncharacterized protein (TIGR03067 family)